MQNDIALRIENLGKRYRLGERRSEFHTLRDRIAELFSRAREGPPRHENIWALRHLSLEVKPGEVVGIIGANGAGKSTLLKILSRITRPTEGRAEVFGRIGSLLEVGTGFHPELTGRENTYLNGAILGMSRREIDRKFDQIVEFAELERFLDTPVKHYSSGMYVRLAFAVAAHLEPEILLVDEVLAVGDARFQRKCLGVMGDVAHRGRTVLFVSHNFAMISNLCDRCVLLHEGAITADGPPAQVIESYLSKAFADDQVDQPGVFDLTSRSNPYSPHDILIRGLRLADQNGHPRDVFEMGQEMVIEVDTEGFDAYPDGWLGVLFRSQLGHQITGINTGMQLPVVSAERTSSETFRLRIGCLPFTPGRFFVSLSTTRARHHRIDFVEHAGQFSVVEADVYGTGYPFASSKVGDVVLDGTWEITNR